MGSLYIITIDGPSGSGKSTICQMLSKYDGFIHIDTGKIYRSIAYLLENPTIKTLDSLVLEFKIKNGSINIYHDSIELNKFIKTEEIAKKASKIAKLDFVRNYVNDTARNIAISGKFVIDGRDAGSIIFRNANLKIFLTAKSFQRAQRRAKELNIPTQQALDLITKRDENDIKRSLAPLIKPQNAFLIDTTLLTPKEVYLKIKGLI